MSADGMIMATPTGSTGYNMSAGGPVIEPGAKMIVLTPICAHTLSARSIILRAEDEIEIEIDRGRDGTQLTVEASFDGNEKVPMVTGDRIIIRKSDETTAFMKLNELSFVEALHRKMSEE
ncbi:MAG: NAD(+)/NADH kinase, partial [Lachnospiraceae bacterium]